jgi:DNA-binding transcriptional LysR family regulator
MELRQLRYFVAVAEELHFRGAAERLHVAQPAVSEQIRKLEAELGVALFQRLPRSVELTPAGAGLLVDARRILGASESAAQSARATGRVDRDRLRIGLTPYGLPPALSAALDRMRAGGRPTNLELASDDARALLADVRAGDLDAAIVHLPGPTEGLRAVPMGSDDAVFAVARGSCLAEGRLTLEDLRRGRLFLLPRAVDPAFHDAVVGALVGSRLFADVTHSSATTPEQLLLEITAGGGAAVVPSMTAARSTLAEITFRVMPERAPSVQLGFVSRIDAQAPALLALIEELRRGRDAPAIASRGGDLPALVTA